MYNPPDACNNICPPSPTPPAGGKPTTKVFSVDPALEVPTVNWLVIVDEPDTNNEPVIWNCELEAKTRFDLLEASTPFPIIKALCADEDILYWP